MPDGECILGHRILPDIGALRIGLIPLDISALGVGLLT